VTSTTSSFEKWFMQRGGILVLPLVMAIALIACNEAQQPPVVKTRITTTSPQTEPQEQPKSPPTGTAPAENSEPKKIVPFYGSTVYEGEVTSVYFYPEGPNGGEVPQTHIKFNHHEEEPEEIYLCGDARKAFDVGNKYRMIVTFEPNTDCISNWRVK